MHLEMMQLWSCSNEFVEIEAFRDGGKSTCAEEAITMEGCFGNFHYGLVIGETYEKACARLAAIDYECRTNVKLHRLFGNKVLARKSIENKIFFRSGAMLEAVGWDQELQSFKRNEHRPDLAWLDDIENRERVRDRAAVDAGLEKFWLELVPAMDKMRRRIRFTQTRRAEYCMVTVFANNPEWLYRGYPLCNGDIDDPRTKSNWPGRWSMEDIRRERDLFKASGKLQAFRQAYMLEVTNEEAKPFRAEHVKAIDKSPWHWMPRFAIYDPARTSNRERTKEQGRSDRYGSVVVSKLGSKILVHQSSGRFWKPSEMIDNVFATHEEHKCAKIGVEKNSLDDWIMQPMRIEMMRRGKSLPLKPLNAPQDRSKDDFIMGLQPFFEAGDIVLVGGALAHPELHAEILNFPNGTRDVLNALAYSLVMFAGQPIYQDFSAANIGDAPNPARGETVYVGMMGDVNETVAVAVLREGMRFAVARDFTAIGPDAVKTIAFELRVAFPLAAFSVWAPPEVFDQSQRVPLVAHLRQERIMPMRGEHTAVARGCLSTRIRTEWRSKRMLTVDRKAPATLNALSQSYAVVVERGGRTGKEPENGTARLVGEALESMVAILDRDLGQEQGKIPAGANVAMSAGGVPYVTAAPQRR